MNYILYYRNLKHAMIFTLLNHSWLSFWRSKSLGRSLGTTIFTWFMVGIMLLYALGAGYMLETLLTKVASEKDPVKLLNGILLFYWMFELIFRIVIQKNVTLNVQYYLTQRISRQSLAHFMLVKSWVNLFLLVTVLLFSRFAFHKIGVEYGVQQGWVWLLFIFGVSFCLHHIVILIHQITKGGFLLPILLSAFAAIIIYANVMGWFDVMFITENLMSAVLLKPYLIVIPIIISIVLYISTHRQIRKNLMLDNLPQSTTIADAGVPRWVQYFNSKGVIGQLVALELRLIWRNKRAKTTILMSAFILIYAVVGFSRNGIGERLPEFLAMLATGAFMINYAQLIFSWESFYIDKIMVNQIKIVTYLKSKFLLLMGLSTISFFLSFLVMLFINTKVLPAFFLWYLVNIGIFIYVFIWLAILGAKRIDANASAFFNYEGINVAQFLIIIPYIALPLASKFFLDSYFGDGMGTYILASLGIIGLLLFNPMMSSLTRLFLKKKYKMLVRLRE